MLAFCGLAEWRPYIGRELRADSFDFALPQRFEQVAHEDDLLALPLGEALLGQMISPALHRGLHLGSETTTAERRRLARDKLTVNPGCAGRFDLRFEFEVRANCERDARVSPRILEPSQLHDRARRPVAGGFKVRQLDVMDPPVSAINTAYPVPLSSSSRPRSSNRPMIGSARPSPAST